MDERVPDVSRGGAGDSLKGETKVVMDWQIGIRNSCSENLSISDVFYPKTLEKALVEADRVLSKYFQLYNNKRYTVSVNNNRARTADYLKSTLQLLSDCRFISLIHYLRDSRFYGNGDERLQAVKECIKLNKTWVKRITKQISEATERLYRDCPRLAAMKDAQLKRLDHTYQRIPPILMLEIKRRALPPYSSHTLCESRSRRQSDCDPPIKEEAPFDLDFSWMKMQEVDNTTNSPRVRFYQRTKEYGFSCDIQDFERNCKSNVDELSVCLTSAIAAVRKKVRKESYNSMSRKERRIAMGADLIKSLRPNRLLGILIRHIRRVLSRNDGRLLTPSSSGMVDILLATVSLNGNQHVRAFLKSVISTFLGSEKEAFFARLEYYILWSSVMRVAKAKLLQRWRNFISSFKRGPTEFSRLAGDVRRSSDLACELMMKELTTLNHDSRGDTNEKNILRAISKFNQYMTGSFVRYQQLVMEFLIWSMANKELSSHDLQMDIITALYGLQTFQDACLASVDMVFRRIVASLNCRNRVGIASIKHITSQVVLLQSKMHFKTTLKDMSYLITNDYFLGVMSRWIC